jgi:hypothetical protein
LTTSLIAILGGACVGRASPSTYNKRLPASQLWKLFDAAPGPKRFVTIRGGDHNSQQSEVYSRSKDGRIYRFKLKRGVRFHDDPCFPSGEGRELICSDVFYSWKRMADEGNAPRNWWLFANTIKGFDSYRERQNSAVARAQDPRSIWRRALRPCFECG